MTRISRIVLSLAALACLVWGVALAVDLARRSPLDGRSLAGWLIGGPLVHDLVLAPLVGVTGLLLARWARPSWRAPLQVGAAVSGILVLLAVPELWRPFAPAVNPGVADRDYPAGLLIWLAAVWLAVLVTGLIRARIARATDHHDRL